jgi:hypothetical protein
MTGTSPVFSLLSGDAIQARPSSASRLVKTRTSLASRKRKAFTVCRTQAVSVTTATFSHCGRLSRPSSNSAQPAPGKRQPIS